MVWCRESQFAAQESGPLAPLSRGERLWQIRVPNLHWVGSTPLFDRSGLDLSLSCNSHPLRDDRHLLSAGVTAVLAALAESRGAVLLWHFLLPAQFGA